MKPFKDAQASLAPPRPSVRHTFGFPFCQRLWALTKRRDNIMVANMVANMKVDMVADMKVDMVANMEVDMVEMNHQAF